MDKSSYEDGLSVYVRDSRLHEGEQEAQAGGHLATCQKIATGVHSAVAIARDDDSLPVLKEPFSSCHRLCS